MKINEISLALTGTAPYISKGKTADQIQTNLISGLEVKGTVYPTTKTSFTKTDDPNVFNILSRILNACMRKDWTVDVKNGYLTKYYKNLGLSDDEIASRLFDGSDKDTKSTFGDGEPITSVSGSVPEDVIRINVKTAIEKLIKFFSEFNFSPSFRFINSLALATDKIAYVRNYFAVQDHQYTAEISEKIKSSEFKVIVKQLSGFSPKPINTRFELFYGEPGSGKTTKAMTLANKCIVCSSDMLPTDLMLNFGFKDGKADFDPSDLWIAMEEGKAIVLDEVNMLPFESLRFLQGITDGKESIDYKGKTIKIHPDFKIYATMNLNVNGTCIPLPAPLVDRSYDIKEFVLTADDLISAILD